MKSNLWSPESGLNFISKLKFIFWCKKEGIKKVESRLKRDNKITRLYCVNLAVLNTTFLYTLITKYLVLTD